MSYDPRRPSPEGHSPCQTVSAGRGGAQDGHQPAAGVRDSRGWQMTDRATVVDNSGVVVLESEYDMLDSRMCRAYSTKTKRPTRWELSVSELRHHGDGRSLLKQSLACPNQFDNPDRQGALASRRISGEPKTERIDALTYRLSTSSSMRANDYLWLPSGRSREGKSRFYRFLSVKGID